MTIPPGTRALLPASIAGLPVMRPMVAVGPPLSFKGASRGLTLSRSEGVEKPLLPDVSPIRLFPESLGEGSVKIGADDGRRVVGDDRVAERHDAGSIIVDAPAVVLR